MPLPVPMQWQGPGPASGGGGCWGTLPHRVLFAPAALWHSGAASRSAPSLSATASGRTSTGTPRCGTTVSGPRRPDPLPPALAPATERLRRRGGAVKRAKPPTLTHAAGPGGGAGGWEEGLSARGSWRAAPASFSESRAGNFEGKSLV